MSNVEQEATSVEITLYTWAIPRVYVPEGEDRYLIQHQLHEGKPYVEGAFLLRTQTFIVQVPAIVDAAPKMIESLEEEIVKQSNDHVEKIQGLREKIANLRCLEAPVE
jgi:hypothetical protein